MDVKVIFDLKKSARMAVNRMQALHRWFFRQAQSSLNQVRGMPPLVVF